MGKLIRQSIFLLLVLSAVTGIAYPVAVTGIAQLLFSHAANGSMIERAGNPLGSELIGQAFADSKHFWSRPSATAPFADNSAASGGSNLGPTNPAFRDVVAQRIDALRRADPGNGARVPVDLVTASASGLDPHISPAAAAYQVSRVARERGLTSARVEAVLAQATERRQFGLLGEPRVNVLKLNLLLDGKL